MSLKFQYQPQPGLQHVVSTQNSDLNYISLNVLRLQAGECYTGNSSNEEIALVILTGSCHIASGENRWQNLGGRKTVFDSPATAVYVPVGSTYQIQATSDVEIAIAGAVADQAAQPTLITPDQTRYERRGVWNWERHIHDVITTVNPVSQRLYIIEVITPPGHWSSVPPHKHDQDNLPHESNNEEIYFYKMHPEQGFGFQRIYTDDGSLDEVCLVQHNSATIQPRGYHPVANHPGYRMYYLNIIAGEKRLLIPYDDPQHAWVKHLEPVIKAREDRPS